MIAIAYFSDLYDDRPNRTRAMRIGNARKTTYLELADFLSITGDDRFELYSVEYVYLKGKVQIITRTYLFFDENHKAKFLLRWA